MARDWSISPNTWDQLLTLLDSDRERAAEQYELLHRKLVRFFKYRGAACPPDAADLTLDRVMRKIEAGEQIQDIGNYSYGVARLILLECCRQASRFEPAEEHVLADKPPQNSDSGRDLLRGCFDQCLHGLPADAQYLIVEYYSEDRSAKIEARRILAEKFNIPLAGLRLRDIVSGRGWSRALAVAWSRKPGETLRRAIPTPIREEPIVDTSQPSSKLKEYLLGGLTESERQEMEQRCFGNDEFFLELEAAEQDLIDSYVRGSLRSGERARFENAFLASPARARRVEIARELVGYIDQKRPGKRHSAWWKHFTGLLVSPAFKPIVAAAAASLIIVAAGMVFRAQRKSPVPSQAKLEAPAAQLNVNATPPPERPRIPERSSTVPAFLLAPGLSRGTGGLQIVRTGDAGSVRLQLVLESIDYARYQASIETPDGSLVFSRSGLTPVSTNRSRFVVLTAPASKLIPGDYILRLSGVDAGNSEPVADYSFRAVLN